MAAKLINSLLYERAIRRVGRSLEIELEVVHGLASIAGLGIGQAKAAPALGVLWIQPKRL